MIENEFSFHTMFFMKQVFFLYIKKKTSFQMYRKKGKLIQDSDSF